MVSSFDEVQAKLEKAARWFSTKINHDFYVRYIESKILGDLFMGRITNEEAQRRFKLLESGNKGNMADLLEVGKLYDTEEMKAAGTEGLQNQVR